MPSAVKRLLVFALVLLMLSLMWRYLIERGLITSEKIQQSLDQSAQWSQQPWLMPAVILTYVVLLGLMFPLTVLVVATGFLFDPYWAVLCATIGSLTSSAVSYMLGHLVGREAMEKHGGRMVRKAEAFMQNNVVKSMVVINLLPIAPFTMTNMLAGAFKMRFLPYMVGSALGLVPGLLGVILLGEQLGRILRATGSSEIFRALGIALLAVGGLALLLYWVNKSTPHGE